MGRLNKLMEKSREREALSVEEKQKAAHATLSQKKTTGRLAAIMAKQDKAVQDTINKHLSRSVAAQKSHVIQREREERQKSAPKPPSTQTKAVTGRLERLGLSRETTSTTATITTREHDYAAEEALNLETTMKPRDNLAAMQLRVEQEMGIDNEDGTLLSPYKVVPWESLDETQQHAVNGVLKHKYSIINGPAGTGKTTVCQHVINRLMDEVQHVRGSNLHRTYEHVTSNIPTIACISYTGKATQNIREKIPENMREYNCMTAHRLLGYYPEYEERVDPKTGQVKQSRIFVAGYNASNPLAWEVIIIDEAGMLPAKLLNEILNAAPHARIIFVGDSAQLPAVQGISPFNVYIGKLPTFTLTKVYRTSEDDLVVNATAIREGERPRFNKKNAHLLRCSSQPLKAKAQIVSAITNLYRAGKFDPQLDTIITPTNSHDTGQLELNRLLRREFNPDNATVRINAIKSVERYAIGDKVICLSNNDDLGITNGMQGIVIDIKKNGLYSRGDVVDVGEVDLTNDVALDDSPNKRQASHITYVYFPTGYAKEQIVPFNTQGDYASLAHGYVTTCHKAQGSEYRNVIVIMHQIGRRLINREWFYTAWTRAKEQVFVIACPNSLNIARNKQALKGDTIEEKAKLFYEKHAEAIEENTLNFEGYYPTGNFDWNRPVMIYNEE